MENEEEPSPQTDPLDQVLFELDAEQTEQFLEVLHNPPPVNEALKALMKHTPP